MPELVKRLKEQFATEVGGKEKTIIPGDPIHIQFSSSTLMWRGESFAFPALGTVPQSLVIAGGAENVIAKKLKQAHPEPAAISGD